MGRRVGWGLGLGVGWRVGMGVGFLVGGRVGFLVGGGGAALVGAGPEPPHPHTEYEKYCRGLHMNPGMRPFLPR